MILRRLLCLLLIACHLLMAPATALEHCPHASTANAEPRAMHDHAAMGHGAHTVAQVAPDQAPSHCQCGCACQDRGCAPGSTVALTPAWRGAGIGPTVAAAPSSTMTAMTHAAYQQPRLRPPARHNA